MNLLRCSESQSGENFKTSADKRQGETMNLISVAMFALNVNVDGNSRQARVNGRRDCVGVLCRAVVCCAVSCCGVLWMSFSHVFLLIFSRKNALPSMMFAFRRL